MNFLVQILIMKQSGLQSISILKDIYLNTLNDLNPVEQQEGPCYEEYPKNRPQGYSYCSFCLYLRREREVKVPVGRIDHIAGDQMYVNFAGDKLYLSDEKTGDKVPVEVFAAILPYSQITYYEAVPSQKKEYLIQACENAFHYFGGVPNAIVPDNLKSAVIKPGGIEPIINDDFAAFADHYGCVVFPARVRKPKDKALVENAVRLLYREVYSKMMGLKFNDLEALNIEIVKHTDALNSRKMYNRSYSRRERFLEVEKDWLHTLPATRFISKNRKTATVMRNSYVSLNNHYYSVPKEYIGDTVELLYDGDTVEIYHKFRHITTHRRDDTPFTYSEKQSHKLPGVLHEYRSRMDDIYRKAREIDSVVEEYIKLVAVAKKYPIQAVRSSDGILSLVERFGRDRLVLACQIAMESNMFGYNEIESILINREESIMSKWRDRSLSLLLNIKISEVRIILTLKTVMKMTSNNKTNRTVEKNMDRIMELLSKLRFYGMLETYRNDCRTTSSDGMTNDEFLKWLLESENDYRRNVSIERLIKSANFRL